MSMLRDYSNFFYEEEFDGEIAKERTKMQPRNCKSVQLLKLLCNFEESRLLLVTRTEDTNGMFNL